MADLFQSEYETIKLRRSQQDGEDLINLLASGSITVVDDPSAKEVEAAQAKLAKLDPEAEVDEEVLALQHTAAFPVAAPEEEAGNHTPEQAEEK